MNADKVKQALKKLADKDKAVILAGFFKTGPGQYGAGDKFLGLSVPAQRQTAKRFAALPVPEIAQLLASPYHEHRLTALLILTEQFARASENSQQKIVKFYLSRAQQVNNWDLVDLSADKILGRWLLNHDRKILNKLARSQNLWERRMAMVATLAFIKQSELAPTFVLAKQLLSDRHDLIHKAVGWMLREAGKRDAAALKKFLQQYAAVMPRTMLRYALEKFPKPERQFYLKLKA